MSEPLHIPVLTEAVLEALGAARGGDFLDGTLGLGGHAAAILGSSPKSRLIGLDKDSQALELARKKLAPFGDRAACFHLPFSSFRTAAEEMGWTKFDGVLLDLGVSSLQLDSPERGFSFRTSGPLDMRMDKTAETSAFDLVNKGSFEELRDCIAVLGEDPRASAIAAKIIAERAAGPIDSTGRLAAVIRQAYPAAWRGNSRRHPATRAFQALRMAVNGELEELGKFLASIFSWLPVGGRLVIISFHSLEDRMVKRTFKNWAGKSAGRLLSKKPLTADDLELAANPRAGSAKLRAIEKTAEPGNDHQ